MSLTVGELVTRPHLRLELVVAGDLDRVIRWVHSSDMPDPAPYLRGDEVVLTAGIWYWHGVAATSFAAGLGYAKAAALGFGTNPLVKQVPVELAEACQAWDLTLFRVPDDVSFIEIAEEFVEAEHRVRERPLLDSLDRSSQFLYSLQVGGGLDGLLRVLSRLLQRRAGVLRRGRGVSAPGGSLMLPPGVAESAEGVIGAETSTVDLGGVMAFAIPIASSDAVLIVEGVLVELTVLERTTIDQALAFVAIELQRARAVAESERRFAGELFDLIGAGEGQHPTVAARLRTVGLDPEKALLAVCCESSDPEASLVRAQTYLEARGRRGALAVKAAQLVGLLGVAPDDDLAALGMELHDVLGETAFVGVGGLAADAHGLGRSMVEARHACRFAQRRRDVGYATHDTLASHALLIALQDDHMLDVFQETLIRPLEEHDARRRTDLVRTLDFFLGSGSRHQPTANALHVHVNTLRLRLARIETITGRSLASMDDRVDLWIALRARKTKSG